MKSSVEYRGNSYLATIFLKVIIFLSSMIVTMFRMRLIV